MTIALVRRPPNLTLTAGTGAILDTADVVGPVWIAGPLAHKLGDQLPAGRGRVRGMEIRAAELTAGHLGRRIKLDRTDDDRTFAIARIVRIRHKQIGDSDETGARLTLALVRDQRITPRFNRLGVVELL